MKNKRLKRFLKIFTVIFGMVYVILRIIARKKKADSVYDNELEQKNSLEGKKVVFVNNSMDKENADGVRGHLEAIGVTTVPFGIYDRYIKRAMDVVLSFCGLIVLSPVFAVIALLIKIEDPGPILFTQKRVGRNKQYFKLHKFRSMKMSTPHDVPTHMLENPEQYITKVGKFLRAHSLDELPQIWDIFIGNMSIIGPRPGLWNQDVLIAERDKYGANDVRPGLTGWAQINGRDELEIPDKARLDGEYVRKEGFLFDIKCFMGTISKIGHDDTVVEGGTGELKKADQSHQHTKRDYTKYKTREEIIGQIGYKEPVEVDRTLFKKVLITGVGSYIGDSFCCYANEHYPDNFSIDFLDMIDENWKDKDFSEYDIVYHVAGIAHADVGNVTEEVKEKYYSVNTDLAVETAKKAKREGVKEFIFMSSMIVYGESAGYGEKKLVTDTTLPIPANFYGDSKLQADVAVRELADEKFHVTVLRPPMIYGKESKGNYPTLAKLARKLPVFPDVNNERSMLYIGNLCELLCQIMLIKNRSHESVVLVPQNAEWTNTSIMVKRIADISGKKIAILKILRPAVVIGGKMPGKIGGLINKAFGNNCYAHELSEYQGIDYQGVTLEESVKLTETDAKDGKKSVLMLASVASMIDQFNMSNIDILLSMGYRVDVACNFGFGSTCSDEKIAELKCKLKEKGVECYQIDFTRNVMNLLQDDKAYRQVRKLVENNRYDLIHCHSPIGGVIGRIVAHRMGVKVIYTAHGFHFYTGGPKKNWMIYYPIEKMLSRWTDVLITINKEDYERAKQQFHAKETKYIPGVGVDIDRFELSQEGQEQNRKLKREEFDVPEKGFVLLSVGELQDRKNQRVIIKALHELNNPDIYYWAVGKGELLEEYQQLIEQYGLRDNVMLLGFRTDIVELCNAADCFVHPSVREGLGIAPLEAMASGLPLISSYVNGIKDYTENGVSGCCLMKPLSVEEMREAIQKMYQDVEFRRRCGINNLNTVKRFDIKNTDKIMKDIYSQFL